MILPNKEQYEKATTELREWFFDFTEDDDSYEALEKAAIIGLTRVATLVAVEMFGREEGARVMSNLVNSAIGESIELDKIYDNQ